MNYLVKPSIVAIFGSPKIKAIAAAIGLLIRQFISKLQGQLLGTVLLLVLFDAITGVCVAIKKKRLSSFRWNQTAIKLANYCILLSIGLLTSPILLLAWLGDVFTVLIIITEVISILENISMLQPRLIPKRILNILAVIRQF